MFRNFLFTMSLSGTVVFLAYITLYPLARRYFPARWRYYSLCMCIFFYLFPLPLLKYDILSRVSRFFPALEKVFVPQNRPFADESFLIIHYRNKIHVPPKVLYMWVLIGFCGIISIILIFRIFRFYIRSKKIHINIAVEEIPQKWQELFHETKAQMKIHTKVQLLCSANCTTPVTWGAFAPVILFPVPSDELDEKTFHLMLKHELVHIKYCHLYIKYIGLLVRTIHWFNPLIYLWFRELCNISEMMCDEIVTKDMEAEQCSQYRRAILNCSAKTASRQYFPFSAHLSGDGMILKRRLSEMKIEKKKKLIPALLFALILGSFGTITAFAYTPPNNLTGVNEAFGDICALTATEDWIDDTAELPYDYYYTDNDGTISPITETNVTPRSCSHQYMLSGTSTQHTPDGKGGCGIVQSQAWKCSKCGKIKIGDEIRTIHYNKCPH